MITRSTSTVSMAANPRREGAVFCLLEHTVTGLLHGKGLAGGFHEIMTQGKDELLAKCLVTFYVLIPFFAFKQLGSVLGEVKIRVLFFRRRAYTISDLSRWKTSPEGDPEST